MLFAILKQKNLIVVPHYAAKLTWESCVGEYPWSSWMFWHLFTAQSDSGCLLGDEESLLSFFSPLF